MTTVLTPPQNDTGPAMEAAPKPSAAAAKSTRPHQPVSVLLLHRSVMDTGIEAKRAEMTIY